MKATYIIDDPFDSIENRKLTADDPWKYVEADKCFDEEEWLEFISTHNRGN